VAATTQRYQRACGQDKRKETSPREGRCAAQHSLRQGDGSIGLTLGRGPEELVVEIVVVVRLDVVVATVVVVVGVGAVVVVVADDGDRAPTVDPRLPGRAVVDDGAFRAVVEVVVEVGPVPDEGRLVDGAAWAAVVTGGTSVVPASILGPEEWALPQADAIASAAATSQKPGR
jgi:hypothetical protein